ncbi:MAG: alkene reductase [Oceanospirillum sp.]|nr:alkene reductase [Oceanospirillum sp.]
MSTQLFSSFQMAGYSLKNRVVLPPMTRSRTDQSGDVPGCLMADYYQQRSSAGLLITEATQISHQGKGYFGTPGLYTDEQIQGWHQVTDRVHAKGSVIYVQLWHVGRVSEQRFQPHGAAPVAPSAVAARDTYVYDRGDQGEVIKVPAAQPQALTEQGIQAIIRDYRKAAENALDAGFDGVEIHSANGYLLDQFLRTGSNQRQDKWGGSITNRCRLLKEVIQAVATVLPVERIGVRISPFTELKDMHDTNPLQTFSYVIALLQELGVGYLHLAEADWDEAPEYSDDFRALVRQLYRGTIICAGGYDLDKANRVLDKGFADLIGFGRSFIANPDLPERLQQGWPLSHFDGDYLFSSGAKGYSDYRR